MQIVNDPGYLVNNYSTNITSSYDGQVIYYPSNTVNGQVVTLISNTSGGLTTGQSITVYNASTNTISVANSTSTTLTQVITGAGGFRTLSAYGICTIICVANNNFVISGGGVY
jgi:hypothetical protein